MRTQALVVAPAIAALLAPTVARAARHLDIEVSSAGSKLAGAHVCLSIDGDENVQAIGYARTNMDGIARFENVPDGGRTYRMNVTHAGLDGETKTFRMMNNYDRDPEPPQTERVTLPGRGATCVDEEPEPPMDPPPPGGGGGGVRKTTPTATKTIVVQVRDYLDRPVVGATVCAGTGPGRGADSAIFGKAQTDSSGKVRFGDVSAGGDGYRRVTISAIHVCPPGAPAQGRLPDGTPVWNCGVGAEYAVIDDPSDVTLSLGAASHQSALDTRVVDVDDICGQTVSDPHPRTWSVFHDTRVVPGGSAAMSVRFDQFRGTAWLYDYEWEVSDPRVLEIVGARRGSRRATIRGKSNGSARVTAHLIRTDGTIVTSGSAQVQVAPPAPPAGQGDAARAIRAFEAVEDVFHSRRCTNCHTDRPNPRQGDNGAVHAPDRRNVRPDISTDCTACHSSMPTRQGYNAPHAESFGTQPWRMAPPAMTFEDRSRMDDLRPIPDICAAIKQTFLDRGQCTDDATCAAAVADHIDHDGLVKWSFSPGGTLTPAHSNGHGHFSQKMREWATAGGACPP